MATGLVGATVAILVLAGIAASNAASGPQVTNGRLILGYYWRSPDCEESGGGGVCNGVTLKAFDQSGGHDLAFERRLARFCRSDLLCSGAAYAPSGGRLALITHWPRGTEILLLASDLRLVRRIRTRVSLDDRTKLAWSPDERRIAFATDRYDAPQLIYSIRANGRGLRRLGRGEAPVWSRMNLIAYSRLNRGGLGYSIYVMRADGGRARRIIRRAAAPQTSWSPDGGSLAFRDRSGNLAVISASRKDVRRLTDPAAPDVEGCAVPAWSPDGREIAFFCSQNAENGLNALTIRSVPSGGGASRELVSADTVRPLGGSWRVIDSLDWQPLP